MREQGAPLPSGRGELLTARALSLQTQAAASPAGPQGDLMASNGRREQSRPCAL